MQTLSAIAFVLRVSLGDTNSPPSPSTPLRRCHGGGTAVSKNLDPHEIMESMKAYSEDLRRKIVDAVRRGVPKSETASRDREPRPRASSG